MGECKKIIQTVDGVIRTHARSEPPTSLAGTPLQPLEYINMIPAWDSRAHFVQHAQHSQTGQLSPSARCLPPCRAKDLF